MSTTATTSTSPTTVLIHNNNNTNISSLSSPNSRLLQSLHNERMQRQRIQPIQKQLSLLLPSTITKSKTPNYCLIPYKSWPGNAIGSIVWEGTLALLSYWENQQYGTTLTISSTPLNILELGSGIGLLSIGYSCIFANQLLNIYITDHKDVIPLLQENVNEYQAYISKNNPYTLPIPKFTVSSLSWGTTDNTLLTSNSNIDIIITADVIYEPISTKLFIETLDILLPKLSSTSSTTPSLSYCIMAYKERGIGDYFFQLLHEYQFIMEDLTPKTITNLSILHYTNQEKSNGITNSNKDNSSSTTIPWPYTQHRIFKIYRK